MEHKDLQGEIKSLQSLIQHKRKQFDQGMQNDLEFRDMKRLYVEIKELHTKLQSLLSENAQLQKN